METIGETCKYEIVWRDRERPKQTKETVETVDTCKYKIVWRDRERPKETKETVETVEMRAPCNTNCIEIQGETKETEETVETSGDTCKYEIVWRDREIKGG